MITSRQALLGILTQIQNCRPFANQDILTFTGFMDLDEVREHVWTNFGLLKDSDKARIVVAARNAGEAA